MNSKEILQEILDKRNTILDLRGQIARMESDIDYLTQRFINAIVLEAMVDEQPDQQISTIPAPEKEAIDYIEHHAKPVMEKRSQLEYATDTADYEVEEHAKELFLWRTYSEHHNRLKEAKKRVSLENLWKDYVRLNYTEEQIKKEEFIAEWKFKKGVETMKVYCHVCDTELLWTDQAGEPGWECPTCQVIYDYDGEVIKELKL